MPAPFPILGSAHTTMRPANERNLRAMYDAIPACLPALLPKQLADYSEPDDKDDGKENGGQGGIRTHGER